MNTLRKYPKFNSKVQGLGFAILNSNVKPLNLFKHCKMSHAFLRDDSGTFHDEGCRVLWAEGPVKGLGCP